jgi:hypothetical protein
MSLNTIKVPSLDLLLMPTPPMVATPLPEANAPVADILQRGFEMLATLRNSTARTIRQ